MTRLTQSSHIKYLDGWRATLCRVIIAFLAKLIPSFPINALSQ